jgi:hypothetical protein
VTKKSRVVENETTEASTAGKKLTRAELNFPLGDEEQGHACLVKTYDRFDNLKLNDMIEFVGILSQDPSLAYDEDDNDHVKMTRFCLVVKQLIFSSNLLYLGIRAIKLKNELKKKSYCITKKRI